MNRKRTISIFLVLVLSLSSAFCFSLYGEGGVSASLNRSSYGGAESFVGTASVDLELAFQGQSFAVGLAGSSGINKSILDVSRFASIPDGYSFEIGFLLKSFIDDSFMFSVIPTVREVFFKDQNQWNLQIGGRLKNTLRVCNHAAVCGSVGYFWSRGFISIPASIGVIVL